MNEVKLESIDIDQKKMELLVKLARTTIKYFYEPKDLLLVDLIIREKRVSEKRLEEVLQFDIKLLRVSLAALKKDRILTMKTDREEDSDGKRRFVNYYYIKFEELVNVVKYKLTIVRNRLETLERESSTIKSFICLFCGMKWTDMEAGELFDCKSLKFHCRFCRKPVVEDTSDIPTDTHELVAKFNVQLGPLFEIIREVDLQFQGQ